MPALRVVRSRQASRALRWRAVERVLLCADMHAHEPGRFTCWPRVRCSRAWQVALFERENNVVAYGPYERAVFKRWAVKRAVLRVHAHDALGAAAGVDRAGAVDDRLFDAAGAVQPQAAAALDAWQEATIMSRGWWLPGNQSSDRAQAGCVLCTCDSRRHEGMPYDRAAHKVDVPHDGANADPSEVS